MFVSLQITPKPPWDSRCENIKIAPYDCTKDKHLIHYTRSSSFRRNQQVLKDLERVDIVRNKRPTSSRPKQAQGTNRSGLVSSAHGPLGGAGSHPVPTPADENCSSPSQLAHPKHTPAKDRESFTKDRDRDREKSTYHTPLEGISKWSFRSREKRRSLCQPSDSHPDLADSWISSHSDPSHVQEYSELSRSIGQDSLLNSIERASSGSDSEGSTEGRKQRDSLDNSRHFGKDDDASESQEDSDAEEDDRHHRKPKKKEAHRRHHHAKHKKGEREETHKHKKHSHDKHKKRESHESEDSGEDEERHRHHKKDKDSRHSKSSKSSKSSKESSKEHEPSTPPLPDIAPAPPAPPPSIFETVMQTYGTPGSITKLLEDEKKLNEVSADIFRLANTNGDHHLSYEEFSEFAKQAAVNSGNEEPDEEEIQQTFEDLDEDGNGFVTEAELRSEIRSFFTFLRIDLQGM
jgi:hypothetical protein